MGYKVFAEAAGKAGVDGVLTVDLPPEEASECAELLNAIKNFSKKGFSKFYEKSQK
jgi:tryptophan synthase alpha subunit